jgi:hypothetical protein
MRKLVFSAVIMLVTTQLVAQPPHRTNTFYFEMAGSGIVLSINYEKQISDIPGVGLFIGVGLGGYLPAIPMGVKYLIDLKNERSFIEIGSGITLAERGVWDPDHQNQPGARHIKAAFVPTVGYRHHSRSGFMWRMNYTPVFSTYRDIPVFAGISVGWRI